MLSRADRLVRFIWVTTVAVILTFGVGFSGLMLVISSFNESRFDDVSAEVSASRQDGVKLKMAAKTNQIKQ